MLSKSRYTRCVSVYAKVHMTFGCLHEKSPRKRPEKEETRKET